MQTRTTNNTSRQIADFLKSLDRSAATTHTGADVDAIGNAAALVCLDTDYHEDNPLYGRLNLVDASAAPSTQIVAALYAEAGVPLSREAAEAIYAGVFTDTGGFRFRNISPAAHELVANLLRLGVIPAEVNERINRTGTIEQMNVVGVSMANAELYGEALISIVGEEDYERTGASELDSKEAID